MYRVLDPEHCPSSLYLLSPVAYEMCAQRVNLPLNNKTYEQTLGVNYITEIKYSIVVMVTNRVRVTGFHLHAGEGGDPVLSLFNYISNE